LDHCNSKNRDAPALSNTADIVPTAEQSLETDPANDDGWDDDALAAKTRKGAVVVTAGATTKDLLVETKALSLTTNTTGNEQDDIAEKLRIEETKAQLAAAKEGMAREAQRLKEEKEKKEEEKTAAASSRFGAAAAAAAGGGGKWVPSRMRAGGGGLAGLSSGGGWGSRMGSSNTQKVNTEDENLFPDLASADAILEKQKAEQPAYKAPTKTPVGGGATWGAAASTAPKTRPKLNLKKKTATESPKEEAAAPAPVEEPAAEPTPEPAAEAAPAEAPTETPAAAPAPLKPKKKKKKKDLSTFGKK